MDRFTAASTIPLRSMNKSTFEEIPMTAHSKERLLNILLVEDDEVDIMNVRRALSKNQLHHSLHIANNGTEALGILNQTDLAGQLPYPEERRLILLDLNMPKMGGIEFLDQLRQRTAFRSIPVIVLTTSDEERDRIQAFRFNVAGYILKPVTFSKFVDIVSKLSAYWSLCEMP